ncbi:ABC transporter ATP-binding protein [Pseudomonas fluorescens]|uniref:Vitamin B12 import ATP-binding protein BtuD n=1 Tax=Pseudomonas fluorescens TaxID=294 RepID=A0A5E6SEX8_PSEFL|nr:ABC transporter ATP-binding protein [Pseudomonas fluorescens]VVM78712.1 Vitamin B12 import ATP-binding protein BtuD [Pseudomonas fluorescens]
MSDISIVLRDASVVFTGQTDLLGRVKNKILRRPVTSNTKEYKINALSNINLSIEKGERVGLIGLNGAGKSTLLKVMARIYPTTTGVAQTQGHVCPMFEFATGFEMNQSGWDNIKIRALLLGLKPKEINAKMQEIAEFSELGEFLNYPVRTYSAGMFIRLAFSVSTAINPEVLLLDEVMGAGDINFAHKAQERMKKFMTQGKILVFSSHSPDLVSDFCERTIWLEKGKLRMDGKTDQVLKAYSENYSTTA